MKTRDVSRSRPGTVKLYIFPVLWSCDDIYFGCDLHVHMCAWREHVVGNMLACVTCYWVTLFRKSLNSQFRCGNSSRVFVIIDMFFSIPHAPRINNSWKIKKMRKSVIILLQELSLTVNTETLQVWRNPTKFSKVTTGNADPQRWWCPPTSLGTRWSMEDGGDHQVSASDLLMSLRLSCWNHKVRVCHE